MNQDGVSKKSKKVLSKLVVLYEHLDNLRNIPKPRSENVELMIEAIYLRIAEEKKKLTR